MAGQMAGKRSDTWPGSLLRGLPGGVSQAPKKAAASPGKGFFRGLKYPEKARQKLGKMECNRYL
jgi:hypothetical protein